MAKTLGKTHKPKVLGADTHSVSLMEMQLSINIVCALFCGFSKDIKEQ